jgi:hypothetical protein
VSAIPLRGPRRLSWPAAALGLVLLPAPARAGGYALHAEAGYQDITNARNSARAVLGSSGGVTFGAGFRYFLGGRFFVGADARYFHASGERVFVSGPGQPVFPLGHPLTVRMIPVHATFGYRFSGRRPQSFVPYLGAGVGLTSYHERSVVAEIEETESVTKASGLLLAGFELGRGTWRYGVEASYSWVPDAIGVGGISKIYDEKDVGGFVVLGRIVFSKQRTPPAAAPPRRRG